jgi:hypothetical protein
MTSRRRRAASLRPYEISGSVIQPAAQRWLDPCGSIRSTARPGGA